MPSATITRGELTSEDLLQVEWTELVTRAETGDSPILSYNLEYDQGTNTWVTVVGETQNYQLSSVIITENVVAGTIYTFRIRAKNVYGWSPQYSYPYIQIAASGKPDKMPRLTSSYDESEPTSVKLSWDAAYDNSEAVDAYQILIRQSDGTFTEELTECNGSTDPVLTQLYCFVQL